MNSHQDNQIFRKALQSIARLKKARLDDLEKITEIEQTLNLVSNNKSNSPCQNCNKAKICEEPCELLESKLPKIHKGSHKLQHAYGKLMEEISDTSDSDNNDEILRKYDLDYLRKTDRIRSDDIYILYKNCLHLFSEIEWRVITLRIDEGLTFKQIGIILGKGTSTVSTTFYRAQKTMERHYQENVTRKKA